MDTHAVEAAQRDWLSNGGRNLPREIKFRRGAKSHRFACIEKNPYRQFPFLLVKFQEQFFKATVQIPIKITKVVSRDVITMIGELDRLAAGLASALAFGRAFGPRAASN